MSLIASAEGGRTFTPAPQGVHRAVCIGLYDLGTQLVEFEGKEKRLHKCLIMWELPDERIIIEKDGAERDLPRIISKEYTVSLNDRSNLYKDLLSWRGMAFTDEELKHFDLKNILGKPCLIQVIHKKTNKGVYANIIAVMPIPKGSPKPVPETDIIFYSIQDNGANVPDGTPKWVQAKIKIAEEFSQYQPTAEEEPPMQENAPAMDDDVPF